MLLQKWSYYLYALKSPNINKCQEWQEKNMDLKTFERKMEGLCIGMQCSVILETERKNCFGLCFFFLFLFCLSCLLLGMRYTYLFLLCLSNGKAPLIKIIIVKVLLMLIFFTNVIRFLYNFVHTYVTDFLKVTNYFDKTITDLLLNNYIPYV